MVMFKEYRGKYPAREPSLDNKKNDDELTELGCYCIWGDGKEFSEYSNLSVSIEEIEGKRIPVANTLLWVVTPSDVRCAHERSELAEEKCARKYLSHTNLTGGKRAHSGGQMAFLKNQENIEKHTIILDGGSSRYMPRDAHELQEIASCFAKTGYDVYNMGWNDDEGRPEYVFRSDQIEHIKSQQ